MSESSNVVRCTAAGCANTMIRTRDDAFHSRRPPEGWVSVVPGWRCPEHHAFEISFDEALDQISMAWAAADQEFLIGGHEQEASNLDYEAVVRAFERGRHSTQK